MKMEQGKLRIALGLVALWKAYRGLLCTWLLVSQLDALVSLNLHFLHFTVDYLF